MIDDRTRWAEMEGGLAHDPYRLGTDGRSVVFGPPATGRPIVGGKLHIDETEHNFYVDPESMERTPTGDPVKLLCEQVE